MLRDERRGARICNGKDPDHTELDRKELNYKKLNCKELNRKELPNKKLLRSPQRSFSGYPHHNTTLSAIQMKIL